MTLTEVLESGLPFKREGQELWLRPEDEISFSKEQVLAGDWEVKPYAVAVTSDDFFHAYTEALKETETTETYHMGEVIECLAKKLGL